MFAGVVSIKIWSTQTIFSRGDITTAGSAESEAGVLNLTLNNQAFVHRFNRVAVKPGHWHHVACSFDLARKQITTIFDGRILKPINLPADFKLGVIGSPLKDNDQEFTFANYSNGTVFMDTRPT